MRSCRATFLHSRKPTARQRAGEMRGAAGQAGHGDTQKTAGRKAGVCSEGPPRARHAGGRPGAPAYFVSKRGQWDRRPQEEHMRGVRSSSKLRRGTERRSLGQKITTRGTPAEGPQKASFPRRATRNTGQLYAN